MGVVTDFSSASAYTAEDFALFGYSVGDGGQLLESDLLQNMQGISTRWEDPLRIYYPDYVTWFDFPFTVWVGPETTALQKNAALEFQRFLLADEQQKRRWPLGCVRPIPTSRSMPSRTVSLSNGRTRASRPSCPAPRPCEARTVMCCCRCSAGSN